eukprot:scaffold309857_cov15-Tisochrysis_lutea.AAC.1
MAAVHAGSMKRSSAAAGNNFYAPPGKQQQQSQGMSRRSAGLPPGALHVVHMVSGLQHHLAQMVRNTGCTVQNLYHRAKIFFLPYVVTEHPCSPSPPTPRAALSPHGMKTAAWS